MADKKALDNLNHHIGFEKLGPDDLHDVAGGSSCGRVYIDDEGCRQDLINFKNEGWTYDEIIELYTGGVLDECTEEEKAFIFNFLSTTWNSI